MEFSRWQNFVVVFMMLEILATGVSFAINDDNYFTNQAKISSNNLAAAINNNSAYVPPQKLSNPPEIVKAVYVTGYSAGTKKYLNYLSDIFKTTEINSVVVDIKDYSGLVSYKSDAPEAKKYSLYNNAILDIDALVRFFHDQNIYVIGRIAVFEDPAFSKARPELAIYNKIETADLTKPVLWQDNNKLSWLDPSSKEVWDYNISLAKDALYHGFDEINFDYIRFPSDGKTDKMGFPLWDGTTSKPNTIKKFFEYTRKQLAGDPPSPAASARRGKISADLFGQTTVNKDDMGIGQIIEDAFENFDYVSPMVYPSHYINGFIGFKSPAEHPYEVVKYSMDNALSRETAFLLQKQDLALKNNQAAESATEASGSPVASLKPTAPILDMALVAKFRPWLQDFDMGAEYTADMIKAEIKATQDALGKNYNGFMLWNPSNIYTKDAVRQPN